MTRYALLLAIGLVHCAVAAETATAPAENPPDSVRRNSYRPPIGFGGYAWNAPLSEFSRLTPDPVYVRIAYSKGAVKEFDLDCFLDGGTTLQCSKQEGIGYHALAEYFVDSQGFRLTDSDRKEKTLLFPITYQFCAHWDGFSSNVAGDMVERMQLCGARLHFRNDKEDEARRMRDPDHVTGSQRVLNWLIENHGEPENFVRKGSVTVVGFDIPREAAAARKDRYDNWYWCSPKMDAVTPNCDASIVFTFDSETGRGQVFFITPPVWMYAHARRYGGAEDDPLYRILHGGQELPRARHMCTGSFICAPLSPKPMPEKMLARFRLPAKDKASVATP